MPLKQPGVASHPSARLGDGRGWTIADSAHNYCPEWGHSGLWMGRFVWVCCGPDYPRTLHTGTLHGDRGPSFRHGLRRKQFVHGTRLVTSGSRASSMGTRRVLEKGRLTALAPAGQGLMENKQPICHYWKSSVCEKRPGAARQQGRF